MSYYLVLTVLLTFAVLSRQLPTDEAKVATVPSMVRKYELHAEQVNWFKAIELCYKKNQLLGSITSKTDYNNLVSAIKSAHITSWVWTLVANEDEWMSDGEVINYNKLVEDVPPHHRLGPFCVVLMPDQDYKMQDSNCSLNHSYSCEYYQ